MANTPRERPEVKIFHFEDTLPTTWQGDDIGGTENKWWFYDVGPISKWFNMLCIGYHGPGDAGSMHTHKSATEGQYECWYLVLDGQAELRTEYGDHKLDRFDAAFMPPDASHQMRNRGREGMWWVSLSSRGGAEVKVDVYQLGQKVEDRPGYKEEYARIMEARRQNGLPTP